MGLEEKAQTDEVDGVTYRVTPVPFGVGKNALIRLVRLLSPVFAAAAKGVGEARVGAVFDVLPSVLTDKDVEFYEKLFGPYSEYLKDDGSWVKLTDASRELHFAGRYLAFVRWMVFAMRCNFGDFFTGIASGAAVGGLVEMVTAPRSASTGGAG